MIMVGVGRSPPQGDVWVSPTRLALALGGTGSVEAQQEVSHGYIIVETNHRVCDLPRL